MKNLNLTVHEGERDYVKLDTIYVLNWARIQSIDNPKINSLFLKDYMLDKLVRDVRDINPKEIYFLVSYFVNATVDGQVSPKENRLVGKGLARNESIDFYLFEHSLKTFMEFDCVSELEDEAQIARILLGGLR